VFFFSFFFFFFFFVRGKVPRHVSFKTCGNVLVSQGSAPNDPVIFGRASERLAPCLSTVKRPIDVFPNRIVFLDENESLS